MLDDSQSAKNNEITIRNIIKSWGLLQNEKPLEAAFKQHILSNLSQITKEQEKVAYILKIKHILKQQLENEALNQSKEYNKKAHLKDVLFKHLLLLISIEIEKDFIQKMRIRKIIREQKAEFIEMLEKTKSEQKEWESAILEHVRQLIERIEREMYIKILFRDLFRDIENLVPVIFRDTVIHDIRIMMVDFLEQSGFNVQQMKAFQINGTESINQFSKSTELFQDSLSELDALDVESFNSDQDIDNAVENQMQTIKQRLKTLFSSKKAMHDTSKEFIRATIVQDRHSEENVQLYEKLVEIPSQKRVTILLNNLIDQHAKQSVTAKEHRVHRDYRNYRDYSSKQTSIQTPMRTPFQKPFAKVPTTLESIREEKESYLPLKTSKQLKLHQAKAVGFKKSFKESEAGKMFDLEMQHLEEKLQELALNKKKQLKNSRAKLLELHQEHGKFTRSKLNPAESLFRLKSEKEQFAKSRKKIEEKPASIKSAIKFSLRDKRIKMMEQIKKGSKQKLNKHSKDAKKDVLKDTMKASGKEAITTSFKAKKTPLKTSDTKPDKGSKP